MTLLLLLFFLFPCCCSQSIYGKAPLHATFTSIPYTSPKLQFHPNDSKFFDVIYFPKFLRIYDYPNYQNQRFFELPLRQEFFDICHTSILTTHWDSSILPTTCFDFFAQNYSKIETYSYSIQEELTNQCLFCYASKPFRNQMDSLYLNTTFDDSLNSSLIKYGYILEKLHWYYLVTANRCLNTTSVAFLTQVYLSHRMHMELRNVDSNPFMCYCFSNNQYAYDCGAYSLFFVPTRTLGINFINFSIVTTMLVGMTVFIVIPRIIIHCCCCMRSFQCKTNCRQIFQLRTFIILYLFCSFVSFLIECINWLPVESEILSYFIFYGRGVFRLLSGIFTVAAFILLMMLWANILRLSDLMQKKGIHHVKKNAAGEISSLNLCEISIIAIVHILFVLQFIISAICYSQFQRYFGIVYGVTTVLCLFYLTFITIGFVSYGVARYFKIAK